MKEQFASAIRQRLLGLGKDTRWLADQIGCVKATVDAWLISNTFSLRNFARLCAALKFDFTTPTEVVSSYEIKGWSDPMLSTAVETRLEELGKSRQWLAEEIGCSRGYISAWTNTNIFSRYYFEKMCRTLGLKFFTKSEAEERYEISGWKEQRRSKGEDRPDSLARAVAALDDERETDDIVVREPIHRLFRLMGQNNFYIGTTNTVIPLLFLPNKHSGVRATIFNAMEKGAKFAFITPTRNCIEELKRNFRFEHLHHYEGFCEGFERFRFDFVQYLIELGNGAARANQLARLATQRFEFDLFPMTPVGHTVSLLGECRCSGDVFLRIMVRRPWNQGGGLSIEPENRMQEERLVRYIEAVIMTGYPAHTAMDMTSEEVSDRVTFIESLRQQIRGEC